MNIDKFSTEKLEDIFQSILSKTTEVLKSFIKTDWKPLARNSPIPHQILGGLLLGTQIISS